MAGGARGRAATSASCGNLTDPMRHYSDALDGTLLARAEGPGFRRGTLGWLSAAAAISLKSARAPVEVTSGKPARAAVSISSRYDSGRGTLCAASCAT